MWGVASSPPPPAPYAPAPADAMSLETAMGSTMDSSSLLYLGVCLALLSSVSQIGKGLQKLGVDTLVRSMSYRTGLEPQTMVTMADPRQACYSHVCASRWTGSR